MPAGELTKKVLKDYHDTPISGYKDVKATQTKLAKKYFSLYIALDKEKYMTMCVKC